MADKIWSHHKGCDRQRDTVKALSADITVSSSSASESAEPSWLLLLLPMTSISSTHRDRQSTHTHIPSHHSYLLITAKFCSFICLQLASTLATSIQLSNLIWKNLSFGKKEGWKQFQKFVFPTLIYLNMCWLFTARCTLVQSAVLPSYVVCLSVCLSVTLVNCDHIGWNSSEIISPSVSLVWSLFATQTSRVYSKGNTTKFSPE